MGHTRGPSMPEGHKLKVTLNYILNFRSARVTRDPSPHPYKNVMGRGPQEHVGPVKVEGCLVGTGQDLLQPPEGPQAREGCVDRLCTCGRVGKAAFPHTQASQELFGSDHRPMNCSDDQPIQAARVSAADTGALGKGDRAERGARLVRMCE